MLARSVPAFLAAVLVLIPFQAIPCVARAGDDGDFPVIYGPSGPAFVVEADPSIAGGQGGAKEVLPGPTDRPHGQWAWQSQSWGRPGHLEPLAPVTPIRRGARMEYERADLIEWYQDHESGVEQGFTILRRPAGEGPLCVEGQVSAPGLRPELSADRRSVAFRREDGSCAFRYADLTVLDANGRAIPAHLTLSDRPREGEATGRLTWSHPTGDAALVRIEVDDAGCAYPLTIDPLLSAPSWSVEGGQTQANYGESLATAGDVNGDGYSDIIVGAPSYTNGQSNEGRAYLYLGSAGGASATPAWTAESNQAGASFGYSVATAGDVNGDGYSDVIVGARSYDGDHDDEGRVYVYLGSATGLEANPAWTAEGNQTAELFGGSVSTAGDVNADGFDDVIVGARNYSNGQNVEGAAFLYLGSAAGLAASPVWHYEGNASVAYFGYTVAAAGDVNGDGRSDVLVGAYGANLCYAFHGTVGGLTLSPAWIDDGEGAGGFGAVLSAAGDVNGDGYGDVIAGAPFYYGGFTDEGCAFVYYGSSSGLSSAPGWMEEGNVDGGAFGWSVSLAGDVNGDGLSDVIIGARGVDGAYENTGRAYVYQGAPGGLLLYPVWTADGDIEEANLGTCVAAGGDVDADGYGDVLVGAPYYTNPSFREGKAYLYRGLADDLTVGTSWTQGGDVDGARLGNSLATAGDVNGDGYSDVIIGARYYSNGQANEGRAYVYHGSRTGLLTTATWTAESDQASATFANEVSSAGDVNGDGYSDVIVGAPTYDNSHTDEGQAWVYHGSFNGLSTSPAWSYHGGQNAAWFGWSVAGAGDVNGDGYGDVIVGAPRIDAGHTDNGRVYLFLGSETGLGASPAWTYTGGADQEFVGLCVRAAGDVNGDGYSDVVVGVPLYSNDQVREGGVLVFHGSEGGLGSSPAWIAEGDQAEGTLGFSVDTAGDVNGDGYSDVIAGSHQFDGQYTDEGRVVVYLGSPTGLAQSPVWTQTGLQDGAQFGERVACGGDVNGDGMSDILIGAPAFDGGQEDEGRATLYLGTTTGPASESSWLSEIGDIDAHYSTGLASLGDVNGDGFSDAMVGAPDAGATNNGRVHFYYGNGGDGIDRVPVQRRFDGSGPIALLGRSDHASSFELRMRGRTPAGRGRVQLEWEVKPLGVPFDGTGVVTGPLTDTGTPGNSGSFVLLYARPSVAVNTPCHWRMRLRVRSPYFPQSPWLSHPGNNRSETDLRTAGTPAGIAAVIQEDRSPRLAAAPNPFTARTEIRYDLTVGAPVEVAVYDVEGRCVARLVDGEQPIGRHEVVWDGRDKQGARRAAGVYFVRLKVAGIETARKITLRD